MTEQPQSNASKEAAAAGYPTVKDVRPSKRTMRFESRPNVRTVDYTPYRRRSHSDCNRSGKCYFYESTAQKVQVQDERRAKYYTPRRRP